jgi:DNA-directed RNA polymerase specialized sigma24 family protein
MLRTLGGLVDADGGLVAALRRNDPDGTDLLVERYGERVYRLAARIIGEPDEAEEVAESALLRVVRTIDRFQGNASFGSWIDRLTAGAAYRKLLTRSATTRDDPLSNRRPDRARRRAACPRCRRPSLRADARLVGSRRHTRAR